MKTLNFINRWTLPSHYCGAHWDGFYHFLGQNRDSGCLTRSNFDAGLKAVKAVASKDSIPGDEDDMATIQVVRENHFLCGWVEWIAIHESDCAALELADSILEKIEDYPVIDENLWSEYESDDANQVWKNCYSQSERVKYIRQNRSQFDFTDFKELMGCVRGEYFTGYASELIN
jgi:hypothetical protein